MKPNPLYTWVYVASRYERRADAREFADRLPSVRCSCVATWIYSAPEETALTAGVPDAVRRHWAERDWQDVSRADCLVLLSDPEMTPLRGGKHVETGIALGTCKPVIVIGNRENIFHWHPLVRLVQTTDEALAWLRYNRPRNGLWLPRRKGVPA